SMPTVLLVLSETPCTQTCASLVLRVSGKKRGEEHDLHPTPAHARIFEGIQVDGEILRSRLQRKPPRPTASSSTNASRLGSARRPTVQSQGRMTAFACIFVPDFGVEAVLRAAPELRSQAVAVLEGKPPLQKVMAMNENARRAGVEWGMSKLQIEGCPNL